MDKIHCMKGSSCVHSTPPIGPAPVQWPHPHEHTWMTTPTAATPISAGQMSLALSALESVMKSHTIGLAMFGPDGTIAFHNPAVSELLDCEPSEVAEGTFTDLLPSNIREQIEGPGGDASGRVCNGSETDAKIQFVRSTGQTVLLRLRAWPVWEDGAFVATLLSLIDITDRLDDRNDAQLATNLVNTIMGSTSDALVVIDADGIIQSASDSVEAISGWRPDELIGSHIKSAIAKSYHDIEQEFAGRYGKRDERAPTVGVVRTEVDLKLGGTASVEVRVVDHMVGERLGAILFVRDLSEISKLSHRIEVVRNTDELTGLLSRRSFVEALDEVLSEAGSGFVVAKIDLVHFHNLNRVHGFTVANEFLQVVATELRSLSGGRPVARIGGDRFAVVIEHRFIDRYLQVLRSRLEGRRRTRGISSSVRMSVGVAQASQGLGAEEVMKSAGVALREAKTREPVGFVEFDDHMRLRELAIAELLRDLHGAIRGRQIVSWFQPVVDLSSGDDVAYEALVRWRHGERGVLAPDDFLPLMASEGLMPELGVHVLTESMGLVSALDAAGMPGRVWVNLSPDQVRDSSVVSYARAAVERGLDLARLGFEITEHTALEVNEDGLEELLALRDEGVALAIDDFGTGYSSLSQLRTLPVDVVKLDRSFLADIHSDPVQSGFVRACIDMCHSLGREVVAEGIENEMDARLLTDLGCDRAQGYHFGRPMPAAEIISRACS